MEVLVPVNSPESARKTVKHAVREYPDASITLFHVLPRNEPFVMSGMYIAHTGTEPQQKYADELFETATETAAEHGGSITTMTAYGGAVREIVDYADESDTDHIVIGSCDRSWILRVLHENVATGVVNRSPVSVTVVK
jgi:nucleotide-binding universal stress UspA family protein